MSVLSHLNDTASKLVLSYAEKINITVSIIALRKRLEEYFDTNIIEQIQFGSYTRGTILPRKADENSDIDYMIVFDNSDDLKPQTFIERLNRFAKAKYSTSEIFRSHPTVVLNLNHIKFDLVPAYKDWYYIHIPAPKYDFSNWLATDPNGFNEQLIEKNQNNQNQIKPTIRLVKFWNAQNGYVYDSYELEKMLVNKSYLWCNNLKDYFFSAIRFLPLSGLPQYKKDKVQRAQDMVSRIAEYEGYDIPAAIGEIKKLIPII